jgi:hypothetical protein
MTVQQIKDAVLQGNKVLWKSPSYEVIRDSKDQWLIACSNGHSIGLTWADGITLNGNEQDFYKIININ